MGLGGVVWGAVIWALFPLTSQVAFLTPTLGVIAMGLGWQNLRTARSLTRNADLVAVPRWATRALRIGGWVAILLGMCALLALPVSWAAYPWFPPEPGAWRPWWAIRMLEGR